MAKRNGFIVKWGICLILMVMALSVAVLGAEQPQKVFSANLVSNFEVFDADIRDAFRGLAEFGGFNVLMDKKVQGNVTIKFQAGINVKEAVNVLARTNGYTCYWMTEQKTVIIGDQNTYKSLDSVYTRVYNLKYADAEAAADTLKVIVPKEQIGIDKRANQLAVKGNILELANVADVIAGLDREMPQISIEMRLEETTRKALDKLGVGWTPDSLGLNLDSPKFTHIASVNLNLWEENTNSKILARPMIATTDSKEASVFIGDKVPVTEKSVDDKEITYTVKYIDVGTKLIVTPRINADNIVTVNVKATLSNITDYTKIGSGADVYEVPNVRNREVGSVIRLRDGETFMLSGLNQSASSYSKAGLKGLQHIPLLGKLFQTTTKEDPSNGTEIVIFITPRIVRMEPVKVPAEDQSLKAENATAAPAVTTPKNKTIPEQTEQPKEMVKTTPAVAAVSPQPGNVTAVTAAAPVQPAKDADAAKVTTGKPVANPQPATPKLDGQRLAIVVKPNQTLAKIASLYGLSEAAIRKDNGLTGNSGLKQGQELLLTIPADHIYRMAAKETLWRISKRYGVSMDVLKEINQLEDVTKVGSGQAIILPVSTKAVVAGSF